jgi:hypothetical protein
MDRKTSRLIMAIALGGTIILIAIATFLQF